MIMLRMSVEIGDRGRGKLGKFTPSMAEGVPPTPSPAPATTASTPAATSAAALALAVTPTVAAEATVKWDSVAEWLAAKKLAICEAALAEAGYEDELEMIIDGDDEEIADMIAAVESIQGIKKPTVKKFKRALAEVRAKGETYK